MEREVSNMVGIVITVTAVGAVLTLILYTVLIGNSVTDSATESVMDIRSDITTKFLDGLTDGRVDNEMPTATAYNILSLYDRHIVVSASGLTGDVTNVFIDGSELQRSLTGRVQLELHKLESGEYVAFIHEEDCQWFKGFCTCTEKYGFNQVKNEYNIVTDWY